MICPNLYFFAEKMDKWTKVLQKNTVNLIVQVESAVGAGSLRSGDPFNTFLLKLTLNYKDKKHTLHYTSLKHYLSICPFFKKKK